MAKFQQVNNGKRHVHRDALEFPDGKVVLLTQLSEGQYATVLQLPVPSSVAMHDTERLRSANSRTLRDDGSPYPGVNVCAR